MLSGLHPAYLNYLSIPIGSLSAPGVPHCDHKAAQFGEKEQLCVTEISTFVRGQHEMESNANYYKLLGKRSYRITKKFSYFCHLHASHFINDRDRV